jgi:hypothetical protein
MRFHSTEMLFRNRRHHVQERILLRPRPITRGVETCAAQASALSEQQQAQISGANTFSKRLIIRNMAGPSQPNFTFGQRGGLGQC